VIGSRIATHVSPQPFEPYPRTRSASRRGNLGQTRALASESETRRRPRPAFGCGLPHWIAPLEIEMGYRSLPTQACILSHTTQQKCVEKSKQERAGIRESSRNFHEKIQGKDRDPLQFPSKCGLVLPTASLPLPFSTDETCSSVTTAPPMLRVNVPRSASLSYRCVVGCQFLGIACTQ
jgi:hypothetical protein